MHSLYIPHVPVMEVSYLLTSSFLLVRSQKCVRSRKKGWEMQLAAASCCFHRFSDFNNIPLFEMSAKDETDAFDGVFMTMAHRMYHHLSLKLADAAGGDNGGAASTVEDPNRRRLLFSAEKDGVQRDVYCCYT